MNYEYKIQRQKEIREMIDNNYLRSFIAKKFGLTILAINNIYKNDYFKPVEVKCLFCKKLFTQKVRSKNPRLCCPKCLTKAGASIWKNNNPEKRRAHEIFHLAVEKKILVRPEKCSKCKKVAKVDGHHTDYSKPLQVVWLCRFCH